MSNNQPFYSIRPNKFIDRQVFLNLLLHLKNLIDFREYRYIGFGSYMFEDHKLMHEILEISDLVSLENDERTYERARFNCPYKAIKIINKNSTEYIMEYEENKNGSIFWLDYTSPNEIAQQFGDFCEIIQKLQKYDIVKITLNANPSSLGKGSDQSLDPAKLRGERLDKLKEYLGDYIPFNASEKNLTKKEYPKLLYKCLQNACYDSLTENPPYQTHFFFPILSTVYDDNTQMMTLTGIILDNHNTENEILESLRGFNIAQPSWESQAIINIPCLTPKEIYTINQNLPDPEAFNTLSEKFSYIFQSDDLIKNYIKYYRFCPNFRHVNF